MKLVQKQDKLLTISSVGLLPVKSTDDTSGSGLAPCLFIFLK